jgi:hypothetical protein
VKSKKHRSVNVLLSGGTALGLIVVAQPGCMPDLDKLSASWHPASGAAGASGKPSHGGSSGVSGRSGLGGHPNGGTPSAGQSHGGASGHPSSGRPGAGGTNGPGGEGGAENGGANEGGAAGAGATSGTGGTSAAGGEAGASCDPGYTTCPGSAECATELAVGNPSGSTFTDCGACGVTCSLVNSTSAACNAGVCKPTCAENYGDCNAATTNDGCEVDLTSVSTCGSCGHSCSVQGATAPACTNGRCTPACLPGYADCTLDNGTHGDDGCETYIDALTNCGTSCSNGVACNPDQVCNAGTCGAAAGLVAMNIPFTETGQGQRYADVFSRDLTGKTLTARVYAPGAIDGYVNFYLSDPSGNYGLMTTVEFSTLSAGWTDVAVQTIASNAFNPLNTKQLTMDFYANGAGPWPSPDTTIYLDSVRTGDLVVNDTFDSTVGGMVTSGLLKIDGSSFGWIAAMP